MKVSHFINYTVLSLMAICGFAVIDKNQWGYYGIAAGSLVFVIIFLILGFRALNKREENMIPVLFEYIGLSVISLVFFLKAWIILFHGIHMFYIAGLLLLLLVTIFNLRGIKKDKEEDDNKIFMVRVVLRVSLVLFLAAEILWILEMDFSEYVGILALALSIGTLAFTVWSQFMHFLAKKRVQNVIGLDRFRSYWILMGFILFFGYKLAVKHHITDEVEFRRLPQEYVDLFYKAESGQEDPVDGKYEYQIYLENYEKFMDDYTAPSR